MKKKDTSIMHLIPISESVRMLEEQFPWLAGIKWNSKSDEDEQGESSPEGRKAK